MIEFNLSSNEHISCLLFGGELKKEVIEPISDEFGKPVVFKTGERIGQLKTKKVKKIIKIKGLGLKSLDEWKTKKEGIYSVDDEVLSYFASENFRNQTLIRKHYNANIASNFCKLLLDNRRISKQLSTYYNPIESLLYEDSCVRGSFIHVETETGRLSCRNPNVQNQPKSFESNVKQHFTSRFKNGKILEVDFKQLEIVVQACLSKDKAYIQDIINGVDFHIKRLAASEEVPYAYVVNKINSKDPEWVQKRSTIKAFSFARAYGAGVKKINQLSGISEEKIYDLIKKEDIMYPQLAVYNRRLENFVNAHIEGEWGYYIGPTNRRYYFKIQPAPLWAQRRGEKYSFSPTKLKNYIVQGTATADIVLIMLGKLFREGIQHRDKFLIVNTIHDSVVFDCKEEYVDFTCSWIKKVLSLTNEVMKDLFNLNLPITIDNDIKVGDSWWECGL